jgi:hypothetical protein
MTAQLLESMSSALVATMVDMKAALMDAMWVA